MISSVTKYFFIFLNSLYLYLRLLNCRVTKKCIFLSSIFALMLSVLTWYFKTACTVFSVILPILLLWLLLSFWQSNPELTFMTTIISFGMSYGFFLTNSLIILVLIRYTFYNMVPITNIGIVVTAGVFQCALTPLLFRYKRFRKGMPFLTSTGFLNVGVGISLFLWGLLIYAQLPRHIPLYAAVLIPLTVIVCVFLLIFWWQKQLTKAYIARLKQIELESLRMELSEMSRQLSEVKSHNEILGSLIHKDNKVIPALQNAVFEYLSECDSGRQLSQTEIRRNGEILLQELAAETDMRQQILASAPGSGSNKWETGIPKLDILLVYMEKQAKKESIHFNAIIERGLANHCAAELTEEVVQIVGDLLENGIIATKCCEVQRIQAQLYTYENNLLIEISDTGIPFEAASFLKFGLEKYTTHTDTGGTGTGLMDMWKIKEKYKASIHITEYPENRIFHKKVAFLFDNKNNYWVYSWRYDQLKCLQQRRDLVIMPLSEEDWK